MKHHRLNHRRRSAFTLIELLLVLVILAVLAALVVPKFTSRGKQARETAAKTDISTISTQINAFEIDTGRYPTSDEGINVLMNQKDNPKGSQGPYLQSMPKDPWNNPYQYRSPGQHNPSGFDLYSWGEDGREGGDDIGNWDASAK